MRVGNGRGKTDSTFRPTLKRCHGLENLLYIHLCESAVLNFENNFLPFKIPRCGSGLRFVAHRVGHVGLGLQTLVFETFVATLSLYK